MKRLYSMFIAFVSMLLIPGMNLMAEISYMRDVNTGCGEIAVDCSTCHRNLNNFEEYTDNQGIYKSDGGQSFCSDPGSWSPVRLSEDQLLADARLVTDAYFERLFGEFTYYMGQAKDEVNEDPDDDKVNPFVEVFPHCPELAAEIAADFSRENGYLVRRVSNRTRNARNTPDDWQAKQLESFEMMAKQGKPRTTFEINRPNNTGILTTKEFEATAFTDEEDIEYFNYMRSITVPPLTMLPCLKCHGSTEPGGEVTPDVLEAIEGLYPYDMALGYKAGAIRGAWTVKIPVVEGKD